MNKPQLQRNLGLVVIFGHTIIVLEIFFFFFRGGLLFEEMTTSLALISPMLAVYTSAIIKHFNQEAVATIPEGETLSTPYVLVTYLFPLLYLALIFAFVMFRANRAVFASFNQFSATLGVLESAFGVYVGQTLGALFDIKAITKGSGKGRHVGHVKKE